MSKVESGSGNFSFKFCRDSSILVAILILLIVGLFAPRPNAQKYTSLYILLFLSLIFFCFDLSFARRYMIVFGKPNHGSGRERGRSDGCVCWGAGRGGP